MIETILIAMLVAKIKGYKVKPLFRDWTIYPILILEIVHIFFQVNIFLDNYYFVQYASVIKKIYMLSYVIPIIIHKEYFTGILGSVFVFIGTLLNNFVIAQNGGKMPVYPNFSYITGYASPEAITGIKGIHILGSAQTKFWFLSDIIDIGWSVLSIGDIFIRLFAFTIIFSTIKTLNRSTKKLGEPKEPELNVQNEQCAVEN